MEEAPGTPQSDTSCRNPQEPSDMPGEEGPGAWGEGIWENALIPSI